MHATRRPQPARLVISLLAVFLTACGGSESTQNNAAPIMQAAPMAAAPAITFSGTRNNYLITRTATGFEVRDLSGKTANVSVAIDASLKFSDMTVNLAIGEQSKVLSANNLRTLIELYIAFFNRVPDADGLGYWIQQIKTGMTVDQLANSFYAAAVQYPTLTGYSATMSNAEFVKIIYKNVLGRTGSTAPPDADINFWAGELNSGKASKGSLVTTMLNAAHGFAGDATWGWVPQLLDNKIAVGSYFAIEQGLGYADPNDSISKGIAIAALVTASNTSSAKTLINIKDSNFSLLATTPTGSGKGDSRDCYNSDLYKQGVVYKLEMASTIRATGTTESFAATYTPNGTVNFKGNTAQEIVMDAVQLSGLSAGIKSQLKSYVAVNSNELITYGSILSTMINTTTNYVVTTVMTPPQKSPFSLPLNQAYVQTYSNTQEIAGKTISMPSTTESLTFLGTESVSVPAGTFTTCKMQLTNNSNGGNTTSYTWYIADSSLRGLPAKTEAEGVTTVATKLSISR
jgi:hypothetical protein